MFTTSQQETFPQREERVLAFWQKDRVFKLSLELRKDAPLFSTFDGPPFATGLPHYGHLLTGTIKDVVLRYKTMRGFSVPRRFGWDCHGLPVENEIEKAKQVLGAAAIEEFGIANFNEECRKIVLRYTKEWERTVHRMGRWVGFDDVYRTMDKDFMESVWWVFSQVYGKGLVYEGFKVMPFSAKLGTPLSNFEANLNYQEVDDPSLFVTFPLVDVPDTSLLAWTTTPWTLPSNLAVMVGPDIDYVTVKQKSTGHSYILAKSRLDALAKEIGEYSITATVKGRDLSGKRYIPLFPYFASQSSQGAFRVILEESVSTEDGTGIVHCAPAFGEIDFYACLREKIDLVCPVDQNGRFTSQVPDYAGLFVKDADKEIMRRLKAEKRVFHQTQIRHRYPMCWRSDTPLIYKAVRTWFVAVEKIKDKLLNVNKEIDWMPGHIKDGRFGKWLENARDWAISRNRYWGTPIPIWRGENGDLRVISSIAELEKLTGEKIDDLHRHKIDHLTFEENGQRYTRIPEVFDCWFESGSMPYASTHFPFENEQQTMKAFPADFISEGIDQTRCWFYTLTVLSAALYDKPAFKNVVVNGIILAEDGNKMSKRLKNYPEPDAVINKYGADAIRLYLLNSGAVAAEDLKFAEKGVEQIMRQVLIPLWNSYIFFATYASIYKWKPQDMTAPPQAEIDRWILSLTMGLQKRVSENMDRYDLNGAVAPLVGFIDQLTDWYIRRSRGRFWTDEDTQDRREAFATLYHVLLNLLQIAASYIPFIAEAIYQELRTPSMPLSVHLCDFPAYKASWRDEALEKDMERVQTVVSTAHGLRKEHKLKVRQPLYEAHIISADLDTLQSLERHAKLIADELNVKQVVFESDETAFVKLIAKPNFRVLGKKVGKHMNAAKELIEKFDQARLKVFLEGHNLEVVVEGEPIVLTPEDVVVERKVHVGLVAATLHGITIALDTTLTDDLLLEGLAREIVNKVNSMRRDENFDVIDRIILRIASTPRVEACIKKHGDYISGEVLAKKIEFGPTQGAEWDLNGEIATLNIAKC